jgi:hypothetical protein
MRNTRLQLQKEWVVMSVPFRMDENQLIVSQGVNDIIEHVSMFQPRLDYIGVVLVHKCLRFLQCHLSVGLNAND